MSYLPLSSCLLSNYHLLIEKIFKKLIKNFSRKPWTICTIVYYAMSHWRWPYKEILNEKFKWWKIWGRRVLCRISSQSMECIWTNTIGDWLKMILCTGQRPFTWWKINYLILYIAFIIYNRNKRTIILVTFYCNFKAQFTSVERNIKLFELRVTSRGSSRRNVDCM